MAPLRFRRRLWRPSLEELKRDRSPNVIDLSVGNDSVHPPVQSTSHQIPDCDESGTVRRCALSMLELSEVRDILDFGNVLEVIERQAALHVAQDGAPELSTADQDEQDDFLLIESSDRSDGTDKEVLETMGSLIMSPSDDSSSNLRRSTSMVSFHSSDSQNLCLSSIMALPQIQETHETCHQPHGNSEALEGFAVSLKSNDKQKDTQTIASCNAIDSDKPCRGSSSKGSHASLHLLDQANTTACTNDHPTSLKTFHGKDISRLRNVSFSSLEIRSYNVTLGDAPTSNGPAISLDWEYDPQSTVIQIDDYENERISTRRSKHEMLMPPSYRQYLLMREAGFSRGEIQRAVDQARRIAKERDRTRRNLALQPVEEALETARKKFGRLVKRSS
eukprot:CCRYP_004798-RA/>CCRYP_004798-RA protein AED:0.12 eAED:0.12 QI:0/-1/0/1/-1/1/1/0/389